MPAELELGQSAQKRLRIPSQMIPFWEIPSSSALGENHSINDQLESNPPVQILGMRTGRT